MKQRRRPSRTLPLAADPSFQEWHKAFLAAINGSIENREIIRRSALCGCKLCRHLFPPEAIREWIDATDGVGMTAMCPKCGIDAVIGSASSIPEEVQLLRELARRWGVRFPD